MDFYQAKKKKKLNFEGNSFVEPEFKIPCKEITNTNNNTEDNETRSRINSASCFGDDEGSSRDSEMSSCSAVSSGVRDTVNVYLRLKPGKPIPDIYAFDQETVSLKGSQSSLERQYKFSSVLEQSTDQQTVYNTCVRPVLSNPFSESGAVFASYGVSNSGKTYTILGEKSAGIVPRALTQLFSQFKNHVAPFPCVKVINDQIQILDDRQVEAEIGASMDFLHDSRMLYKGKALHESWLTGIQAEHQFEPKLIDSAHQQIFIWVSFVEIYNEKMIDLFKSQKPTTSTIPRALKIISNNRNSYVHGLTWLHVNSLEKALELLQAGLRRVNYAATGINKHSSRSHTIFTINIIAERDSNYEFAGYKFCDLAGAERVSKTGNIGERIKEAGGINTSLMVLGKCLEAVQHNQKPGGGGKKDIVPVRESKLTFLLQSSLMGHEKFVMIVNMLPTVECFEENINVLHFGSIANKIITRKTEVKKFSRMSSRYTYFLQNVVNSPKMNSSVAFDDSVIPEGDELSSILSHSFMTADELRHELRLKDVEIATLRNAFEESERRNVNLRKEIMNEFQGCNEMKRESDKKYFEESFERQQIYHEKKMESMRMGFEKKLDKVYEVNDFLQAENQKLKRKLGIKDDEDIIDLDDSEEDYSDEEEEKSTEFGNDEIENIAP